MALRVANLASAPSHRYLRTPALSRIGRPCQSYPGTVRASFPTPSLAPPSPPLRVHRQKAARHSSVPDSSAPPRTPTCDRCPSRTSPARSTDRCWGQLNVSQLAGTALSASRASSRMSAGTRPEPVRYAPPSCLPVPIAATLRRHVCSMFRKSPLPSPAVRSFEQIPLGREPSRDRTLESSAHSPSHRSVSQAAFASDRTLPEPLHLQPVLNTAQSTADRGPLQ